MLPRIQVGIVKPTDLEPIISLGGAEGSAEHPEAGKGQARLVNAHCFFTLLTFVDEAKGTLNV